ncbi:MAG TPA: FAD binding domain-containing protein [Anaeromyxobacteraceae bacterium]|nr:FAD binding domain-containing protein [Anaeromyxobacteraceae bacterium]
MASFEWLDPESVAEALKEIGPSALPKAGGIDLMDRLKEGLEAPTRIVNLRRIRGLDHVRDTGAQMEIGALVTLAHLAADPVVRSRLPALAEAALRAATPNVRNVATVGGNLLQRPRCWYFRREAFPCLRKGGDTCFAQDGRNAYHAVFENDVCAVVHPSDTAVALVAYGARAAVAGQDGTREVLLEELFVPTHEDVTREHRLGEDELLVALHVPAPGEHARSAYLKLGERDSADWPLASAAVVLEVAGDVCRRASVVLGAAAAVPWRAREAEAVLMGGRFDTGRVADAAAAAVKGATPLRENGYKVKLLEVITRRALLAAGGLS